MNNKKKSEVFCKGRRSKFKIFQNQNNLQCSQNNQQHSVLVTNVQRNEIALQIRNFYYDNKLLKEKGSDLAFETFKLKKALQKYFPKAAFSISHTTLYRYDIKKKIDFYDREENHKYKFKIIYNPSLCGISRFVSIHPKTFAAPTINMISVVLITA